MTQGRDKKIDFIKSSSKTEMKGIIIFIKQYKNKLNHLVKIEKKDYFENQFIKYKK